MIAWSVMGDANTSIPTPQPVIYRPMFGSFGKATARSLTFMAQAALDAGISQQLGLNKTVVAVQNCRQIGKLNMVHNDTTPTIDVRSRNVRSPRRRRPANLRTSD